MERFLQAGPSLGNPFAAAPPSPSSAKTRSLSNAIFSGMAGDHVVCPHCGGEIKRDAKSCRHCGSDDSTGWSEGTYMDGIDTPEEGDYEDGLEREGFRRPAAGPNKLVVGAVSTVLVLLFLMWLLKNVL